VRKGTVDKTVVLRTHGFLDRAERMCIKNSTESYSCFEREKKRESSFVKS
jgi:hypothetical protein